MEETTTLMNTKASDLTVGQILLVNLAAPIVMIGGVVIAGAVIGTSQKVVAKFKSVRENRKNTADKK